MSNTIKINPEFRISYGVVIRTKVKHLKAIENAVNVFPDTRIVVDYPHFGKLFITPEEPQPVECPHCKKVIEPLMDIDERETDST